MNDTNRILPHNEIGHIFKNLLPAQGMPERPEQIALSHRMLDAMLDGNIALCDAGTGIGKTYAYLVAGTAYQRFLADKDNPLQPILVSTSSIALQRAVRDEYLPFLSAVLMAAGRAGAPIQAVTCKENRIMSKSTENHQKIWTQAKQPKSGKSLLQKMRT